MIIEVVIMQQYFLDSVVESEILFNKEQQHHMKTVMRMKSGDVVYAVSKDMTKYKVTLEINEDVKASSFERIPSVNEMGLRIYLAQGMIKGERWDYFLQKASEFGATDIIPLVLKRNVVKVNDGIDKKLVRFQKIVQEAAEQSKRDILPNVHMPMTIKELKELNADLKLVAYENRAGEATLKDLLKNDIQSIIFVAGAEGGFDPAEVKELEDAGFHVIGLGPRILRAESASLYFLSCLSYERGMC